MPYESQIEGLDQTSTKVSNYLQEYGTRLVLAVILFFVFTRIIKLVLESLESFFKNRKTDPKIVEIAVNLTRYILYLFLVLILANLIGIDIAYIFWLIIAVIAIIAFTMQNTLVNVGAGFVINGIKLFKKGDYIIYKEFEGNVNKIELYHTEVRTSDNSVVYIPNSELLGGVSLNTDKLSRRRVDVIAFIDFDNDIDAVRKTLKTLTKGDERILDDTEPLVIVRDIDKVSMKIRLQMWTKRQDYWDVLYDYNEKVIKALQKAKVKFPDTNVGSWSQTEK